MKTSMHNRKRQRGWLLPLALLALGLGGAAAAHAQALRAAGIAAHSGGPVSNWVAVARSTQVYSVEVNNFTGSTLYMLVFDKATNAAAGATTEFVALPIETGKLGYRDWGVAGAPFVNGVTVCLSTTPFSQTNASAGGSVTVVHTPKGP